MTRIIWQEIREKVSLGISSLLIIAFFMLPLPLIGPLLAQSCMIVPIAVPHACRIDTPHWLVVLEIQTETNFASIVDPAVSAASYVCRSDRPGMSLRLS